MQRRKQHQRNSAAAEHTPSPYAKPTENKTIFGWMKNGFKRYWFIAMPAIMLNIGVTLDHVIAKNNENAFRVTVKKVALEAMEATRLQDEEPLNETLQAHWITTDEDGNLDGRISAIEPNESVTVPIERLDVALVKNGEKVSKTVTGDDGKFVLKDVEPGVYTLVASGRNGFLAYGVQVLPKLEEFNILDADGNTQVIPHNLKRAFYVSHFNLPQDAVIADELQIDAAAVPPEFSTLKQISQNYLPAASAIAIARDVDDSKAIAKATQITGGFKYALSDTGSFNGRVQPIATSDGKEAKLTEMNVFLTQDDIETARVAVEENGKFEIENVEPGVYSLVAAGKDGFAAFSLELVQNGADQQSSTSGKTKAFYVSHRPAKRAGSCGIAIITNPEDIKVCQEEIERSDRERKAFLLNRNGGNGNLASNGFSPGSGGTSSGFSSGSSGGFSSAPSGSFSPGGPGNFANGGFGQTATRSGGVPRSFRTGGGGNGLFALAAAGTGLALGVTSISSEPVVDPGPASPVTLQ